jgi:ParB-like chromosome segregation protein Spo0J
MELEKVNIEDIFITKEEPDTNKIIPLIAASVKELGFFIHPPALYRDDKGRLLIAAGRKRVRAAQSLGWKTLDALVFDVQPLEADLMMIDENLRRNSLTDFQRAKLVRHRVEVLRRMHIGIGKTGKRGRPSGGIVKAIERAAEEIGVSKSTIKRELKIADIATSATEEIIGTKLENDKTLLVRIAQQPKELHLRIVKGLKSNLTFEEVIRRLERQELKGKDWPDDQNSVFIHLRKEILMLAARLKGEVNRNYNILSKYKHDTKKQQAYKTAERLKELYNEMIGSILLSLPSGPCPYCEFVGCEKCSFDGWGTKDLLLKAQDEGIRVKTYFR